MNRSRTSLILVDQVVLTLSACVATFSELDVFSELLQSDSSMGIMDRVRWARKSDAATEYLEKLRMHKNSLSFMLTIIT